MESQDSLKNAPARPSREAVFEVAVFSIAATLVTVLAISITPNGIDFNRVPQYAPHLGSVVIEHIGWGFGIYVTVLLGFYAAIIGGQIIGKSSDLFQLRRTLGVTAETLTGVTTPTIFLIITFCISDPVELGSLFIVIPAFFIMLFLAIQLGSFVVAEPKLRLKSAEKSMRWSRDRLGKLRNRSKKSPYLAVAANCAFMIEIATLLTLPNQVIHKSWLFLFINYLFLSAFMSGVWIFGMYTYYTSRGKIDAVISYIVPIISCTFIVFYIILIINRSNYWSVALGMISIVAVSLFSSFLPVNKSNEFGINWSLRGVARKLASRTVVNLYRKGGENAASAKNDMRRDASPYMKGEPPYGPWLCTLNRNSACPPTGPGPQPPSRLPARRGR